MAGNDPVAQRRAEVCTVTRAGGLRWIDVLDEFLAKFAGEGSAIRGERFAASSPRASSSDGAPVPTASRTRRARSCGVHVEVAEPVTASLAETEGQEVLIDAA